jgi:hypothetical protein
MRSACRFGLAKMLLDARLQGGVVFDAARHARQHGCSLFLGRVRVP